MAIGTVAAQTSAWELPETLNLVSDIERLKKIISDWSDRCDKEVRELVRRQMSARAKYFRPATIFACHRSVSEHDPSRSLLSSAAALELIHNVSLIVDDILDHSRFRRGNLSLHCRFGFLPALMTDRRWASAW